MARQKKAAAEAVQAATIQEDAPPVTETATAQETPPTPSEVDPFPRNIRTVNLNGYTIRLNQDRHANEMQIQFGSGQRNDKPSDGVLDLIRSQLVPGELKTRKEREENKDVPWFKFRSDPETGEGSWRLWMRNHPNAAREKAEQVFKDVVDQVAQERGAGRGR
jgi:hypothetical protein